ncbi:c-type cytochrome [Hydrogenophaga sp. PBL-H3]|uniref:c-type cytochrome n=1 Tax=Hydrogenophaga sp. PBL-H3 TaxID=434010 RepID=UPI00131FB26E|nr:cytochrome c [Hydrogenophaga sp. PBL-H3]QHE74998.1 cytochrome c [Hydrogenophaga sp. PBL-H3]QHE79425.1 cytochrome c [Hydrogenophaga sp. PBL-H3]
MKMKILQRGLLALVIACSWGAASAQPAVFDPGKQEFADNCASCHGTDGKGNGPLGELLRKSPPDLTQLAKKNQGVLPINRLYAVIDGAGVPSHGSRDMPVWGREYQIDQAQQMREARGHYDSAGLVRARILVLLEYISRIQTP